LSGLLIDALEKRPGESIVYLPLSQGNRMLPVRVSELQVNDRSIRLTFRAMQ
jgi:hypothetical protein